MTSDRDSYRRIIAAASIVGGATIITIVVGLVRTKLIALGVGPDGIGLIGVYMSISATAAALGGLGLGFGGVRQIAIEGANRAAARAALWRASWPLALLAVIVVWFAREEIAGLATGTDRNALGVGLVGIAAGLTIVSAAQTAVIQGYQRVGDLARSRIYGSLISLAIGVPAAIYGGSLGLVIVVIAVPLGAVVAALPYRPVRETTRADGRQLRLELTAMARLGAATTLTTTLAAGSLVVIRAIIIDHQDVAAAGLYQAAYSISAMNVALVLSAMAADYFPRLSGIQSERDKTANLVNQQLHSALLLGIPLLILLIGLAPLVLNILYSTQFQPAADLLRWQAAGELLKLPGWALGFLLIARGDARSYIVAETLFVLIYLAGSWLLLPEFGLLGLGLAYLAAYAGYSFVLAVICRQRHGVRVDRANLVILAASLAAAAATIAASSFGALTSAGVGLALAGGFGLYAVRELERRGELLAALRNRRNSATGDSSLLSGPGTNGSE